MDKTRNVRRSLRHKPSRQLDLDTLCLDARYCSTPSEQDVLGNETSITKDPAPQDEATIPPTTLSTTACDVDDDGDFGTGTQTHQISFLYQVQTTLNQTVLKMEEEVLFLLEKALAQQLLTNVFADSLCSLTNITVAETRISLDQPTDGATVSGLLSEPRDTVLPGVDGVRCRTSLLGNARRCFIVSGALTISSQDDSLPLNWTEPFVVVSAKEMMEQGRLNAVHPDVVDVSYVVDFGDGDGPDTNLTATNPPVIEVETVSEEKKVEPWAWVLLSLGILGGFVAFCAFRRRRKSR